jgi:predicted GIY-YIG superfamily endonuclease
MGRKLITSEFVEKAVEVHGKQYDYSLVKYINNRINVVLICKLHGQFEQNPSSHLQGSGCKTCAYDKIKKDNWIDKKEFEKRCYEKFKDRYSYDISGYEGLHSNITVNCQLHGEISINAKSHLQSTGCRKCTNELKSRNNHNKKSTEDFLDKIKEVHEDKYDYSLITIIHSSFSEIDIICKSHGKFKQRYNSHRAGYGCSTCAKMCQYGFYSVKNAERNKDKWINIEGTFYVLNVDNKFIKIGITKNLKRRLKEHRKNYNNAELILTKEDNLYNLVIFERNINEKLKSLGLAFIYSQKNETYKKESLDIINKILNNENE